jgi:hypothetical protein
VEVADEGSAIVITPLRYWEDPVERERGLRGEVSRRLAPAVSDELLGGAVRGGPA